MPPDVSAVNSTVHFAGNDLYVIQQHGVQASLYFEPCLDDFSERWINPPKAHEIAASLRLSHLVIISGEDLDDKIMVARLLAFVLRSKLPDAVRVREWYRTTDAQKLAACLDDDQPTILLLREAYPHHLGHGLEEFNLLLSKRQSYAVITTTVAQTQWQGNGSTTTQIPWFDLAWDTFYGPEELCKFLLKHLRARGSLPDGILPEGAAGGLDAPLVDGLTLREAISGLKTPVKIRAFAEWLVAGDGALTPKQVLAQFKRLAQTGRFSDLSYRALDRRAQLFALGLAMFDGLPADQIFAGLEVLVKGAWRTLDPALSCFDLADLESVAAYFGWLDFGRDGLRIEAHSRELRDEILRAAWSFHRRYVTAALPLLAELIKRAGELDTLRLQESSRQKSEETTDGATSADLTGKKGENNHDTTGLFWRSLQGMVGELYGSAERRRRLNQAIIDFISHVGLLSFQAIQPYLLDLAVRGSLYSREAVARALAGWRSRNESAELFRVLDQWWEEGQELFFEHQPDTHEVTDFSGGTRATVAVAVGLAAQYDPPGHLNPKLVSFLEKIGKDRHPAVRRALREVTLPLCIASHSGQLESMVRSKILSHEDLVLPTAMGMAYAYILHPKDALEILDRWPREVCDQRREARPRKALTLADKTLIAAILAYGLIDCKAVGRDGITPQAVVKKLGELLGSERHGTVRQIIFFAVALQATRVLSEIVAEVQLLLEQVTPVEREYVVSLFLELFLHERDKLKDWDEIIKVDGRNYKGWIRTERHRTQLEEIIESWVQDESRPNAQQIAFRLQLALFSHPVGREEERLREVRRKADAEEERKRQVAGNQEDEVNPELPRPERISVLAWLAIFLATFRQPSRRAKIRGLFVEILARGDEPTEEVKVLLDKWGKNPQLAELSQALHKAIRFYALRWRIVAGLGAIVALLLLVMFLLFR